jgi:ElaB/YqjD/DUF883 family membrane-anchored ribosome-binding protein
MTAKDTLGYLGNEELDAKQVLRAFAATLEKLVASETGEAVEQVRTQARTLLAEARPLIDKAVDSPDQLREVVRKHPLLAVGVAGLAGFVLASLGRR